VHFNVTELPTAHWTGEQMIQAFPVGSEPRYLLCDRDRIYGEEFRERIRAIAIEFVAGYAAEIRERWDITRGFLV
jgi:putative transposase